MLPDSATIRVNGIAQIRPQQRVVLVQEAAAARLAPAPLGDEIGAPGRKEEAVAVVARSPAAARCRRRRRESLHGV